MTEGEMIELEEQSEAYKKVFYSEFIGYLHGVDFGDAIGRTPHCVELAAKVCAAVWVRDFEQASEHVAKLFHEAANDYANWIMQTNAKADD